MHEINKRPERKETIGRSTKPNAHSLKRLVR